MTNYVALCANLVLATYATRSGSFADGNIAVSTDRGTAKIEQTPTNIVLHILQVPNGAIFSFR